ncbi:MAG: hypothetical protein IKC59_08845, partial [Clostridia bacterium]|nr:hypothetical protein [Clostridia bacterium]
MKNIRFLSILLTLCMLLAMVACSNDETPETPSTETPTTEAPTTEAPDDDDDPDDTTSGTTENGGSDTPTLKYTWATQGGDGTAADPLIINQNNFVDFYNYYLKGGFEAFVDSDEHFKLGSDIVVNEGNAKDWATTNPTTVFNAPMNSLVGTFDGAGHTISGLCIKTQNKYCAIFDSIGENATLKNLRVVNSYFNARGSDNGYWNTGTFAGRMDKNSTIENCY